MLEVCSTTLKFGLINVMVVLLVNYLTSYASTPKSLWTVNWQRLRKDEAKTVQMLISKICRVHALNDMQYMERVKGSTTIPRRLLGMLLQTTLSKCTQIKL